MADVMCIAPTRIGGTDIDYAQGMRGGAWLFFTGHTATDFAHGLAGEVAGLPGRPLGAPPRYRREGDFIMARLARLIAGEGGDLRHIVRVDQYYPHAQVVNAYQRARKAVLKEFVPPRLRRRSRRRLSCAACLAGTARGRADPIRRREHSGSAGAGLQDSRRYVGLCTVALECSAGYRPCTGRASIAGSTVVGLRQIAAKDGRQGGAHGTLCRGDRVHPDDLAWDVVERRRSADNGK
jgi:hypothetical protein